VCDRPVVCGPCQSSLFDDAAALHGVWSEYERTVLGVARLHSADVGSLDVVQSRADAVRRTAAAVNQSASLYSVWSYLTDRLSFINDSLRSASMQVSTYS